MARKRLPWIKPTSASWDRAHARTGRALYRLSTGLGGAFVKLGQVIAARADFFPPSLVEPLKGLHDRVPARPFSSLRRFVAKQVGDLDSVFAEVTEEPIAAASLAQVHRARLVNGNSVGDDVVIKVQYPEVRRTFPADLKTLRLGVRVIRLLNRHLDLRSMADELADFIFLELDFAREAVSTERVRARFGDDPRVHIPRVYTDHSSDQVLVLEYVEGERISDLAALDAAGHDRRDIAERVAAIYCTMLFEHDFFHGDPHPGNLLVQADGTIGLLDFGLSKELPESFANGVAQTILSVSRGDSAGAMAAARDVGFQFESDDPNQLFELMRMVMGDYSSADGLMSVLKENKLKHIPSHFTLIARVLVLLNGLSHLLVPGERVIPMALARILGQLATSQPRPVHTSPAQAGEGIGSIEPAAASVPSGVLEPTC